METTPVGPMSQKQTPEDAWSDIESEVYEQLDKVLGELVAARPQVFEGDMRAHFQDSLRLSEKKFFTNVLATAQRAAETHQNIVTLLFDVDETIGCALYGPGFSFIRTVLRPSLYPLLKICKRHKWNAGLLTARGDLPAQLDNEAHLKSIRDFLSDSLLFSVREIYTGDSARFARNIKEMYGGPNGIVDDSKVGTEINEIPSTTGDQQKIMGLAAIREKLPQGAHVIVDDMPYAQILNEHAGFYGVYLDRTKRGGGCFVLPN